MVVNNLPRKPVSSLKPGDAVDLENDAFADKGTCPEFEFELQEVEKVEIETSDCTAVYFVNGPCIGFPPDHLVPVRPVAFERDDEETPVLFRRRRGKQYDADGITAVFPCEPHSLDGTSMSCYAHVGQHGGCSFAWYNETRAAKPEEYASLVAELEGAPYGYRLKVYSRMTRQHREAFRTEVQRLRNSR